MGKREGMELLHWRSDPQMCSRHLCFHSRWQKEWILAKKKFPLGTLRLRVVPIKGREEFRLGRMQKVIHGTVIHCCGKLVATMWLSFF